HLLCRIGGDGRERRADRVRERYMGGDPPPEEGADAPGSPIEELIGHENVERAVLLLQAADSAGRQQPLDAESLEAVDVRPEVQLCWKNPMADAVPREERHALASERAQDVRSRRI